MATAKTKKKSGQPKKGTWVRRILIVLAIFFAIGLASFGALYAAIGIPDPNAEWEAEVTNVYYSDGETKIGRFQTQNREAIAFDQMPESAKAAVIAAEDRSFYENRGISITGMTRAFFRNLTTDTLQGGSTITQQYVKVLYLNQDRSSWRKYWRKIKESIISLKLYNQQSKNEILEGYLNTIYFGNGAYGVETAAQTYFKKNASELTIPESAALATIINNPSAFDPYSDGGADRMMGRYQYVLDGMALEGAISRTDAEKYKAELPEFKPLSKENRFGGWRGHLLRMVEIELKEQGFTDAQINGGGLKVITTFDKKAQEAAVEAVESVRPADKPELNIGLASVEPGTGATRALYGGNDFIKSQLNWATLGTQPGSTMKVFAVHAALQNGYSLKTKLNGKTPYKFPNGDSVSNAGDSGGKGYGTLDLMKATRSSVNTAFVDLTMQMNNGPEKIWNAALEAGIPQSTMDKIDKVPVIALGFAPIAPIDMANAYATYAAEGQRAEWYTLEKVIQDGDVVSYEHTVTVRQAVGRDVAADVTAALRGVVSGGTGGRGATQCPTAGKTGTATFRKTPTSPSYPSAAWFVGYTPRLATAVSYTRGKYGNEITQGYLASYYGGFYPAMTFSKYMRNATSGLPCLPFPKPANIKATQGTEINSPSPSPIPSISVEPQPSPTPTPSQSTTKSPSSTPTPTSTSTATP